MNKFYNYLFYSGAAVIITVNPIHWAWIPFIQLEKDMVWEPRTFKAGFLFLTIRIWIDDGSW